MSDPLFIVANANDVILFHDHALHMIYRYVHIHTHDFSFHFIVNQISHGLSNGPCTRYLVPGLPACRGHFALIEYRYPGVWYQVPGTVPEDVLLVYSTITCATH